MNRPARVAIVGEDTAHAALLGVLLRASIEVVAREAGRAWIIDNLTHDPEFQGSEDLADVLDGLHYVNSIRGVEEGADAPRIDGRPIKLRGHLGGVALAPEAQKWRALLVGVLAHDPDAVMVARDTDGHPEKLDGLRQVIRHFESLDGSRVIVIAAPHQDAECWLVAGFEPIDGDPREVAGLSEVRGDLGFDPRLYAERLTAQPNHAPTDAKRVLRRLLGLGARSAPLDRDETRTHHGRLLGDLERLRQRGRGSGLTGFLDEIRSRVVARIVPGVGS